MKLLVKHTLKDVLALLKKEKKQVEISLSSGKSFTGIIQVVGDHCVSLKQVGQRSFFDAIFGIEDIVALEVKVRTA
jgi:sRNA-binding regulator protein Hfq